MRRLVTFLLALSLGCDSFEPGDPLPTIRVTPPEEVTLREGQTAVIVLPDGSSSGRTITFAEVVSDSRCPDMALCIWEGDAAIRLELEGAAGPLILHTPTEMIGPRSGTAGPYRIELVALSRPDPLHSPRPRPDSYRATLRIAVPSGG